MAKTSIIKLAHPIKGHKGDNLVVISEIALREPKASDFFELGEPMSWAQTKSGMVFNADKEDTIRAYIERCAVEVDPLLLEQLSLTDGIRLRDAVVDFFVAARATESETSATSSSSS